MDMDFNSSINKLISLPDDLNIHPDVKDHYKHNFITNFIDSSFFILGESFVSTYTIITVFASTLTNSPLLIGLIPALIEAGWFLPQLFMAGFVQRLHHKMPFARWMAGVERVPFIILPLTAYALHWISKDIALIFFFFTIALRGFASGMVALPWQEIIATVIPVQVRSRYFGFSHTFGKILGVFGAGATSFILAKLKYPDNYALSFLIGGIFIWISFFFFSRTIEPDKTDQIKSFQHNGFLDDIKIYHFILKEDKNFVRYLISRVIVNLGRMANAFFAVYGIYHYNLSDEAAGFFTALVFISGTLGFFLFGLIGDKIGPRKTLVIADTMQITILILALISPGVWSIYAIFFIFGFSQSAYLVGDLVIGMELGPEDKRPSYIGMARTFPGIVILIAPIIGGTLIDLINYKAMFMVALVLTLFGGALVYGVKDRNNSAI